MCSEPVIELRGVAKQYRLFEHPRERLFMLLPGLNRLVREQVFHALRPLDLSIARGEVVGIVGRNGAGKSTLLELICQTLPASAGMVRVRGRVSPLLLLGAGFNPEFTGGEIMYMSAAILGMGRAEVDAHLDAILAFADIGAFIEQPVKTYSSGMFVRLAFAVATAVNPDILVVDEALSVGDGAFARKSFERIMAMKAAGKTILFCSHSLYQVEAICSRALWIESGRLLLDGAPDAVVAEYQCFLDTGLLPEQRRAEAVAAPVLEPASEPVSEAEPEPALESEPAPEPTPAPEMTSSPQGHARLGRVTVSVDGQAGRALEAMSGVSTLAVEVAFDSDPALPCPTVAVTISTAEGQIVTSAATWEDGVSIDRDAAGRGRARLSFEALGLLKGRYQVGGYLFCERGVHSYGWLDPVATLNVSQRSLEKGVCRLPHVWDAGLADD